MPRVLTRHTCCHYRQRFAVQVLTELEIFVIAQSPRLVVASDVSDGSAGIEWSYATFPFVDVVDAVAMCHTAAGEAQKAWSHVGNIFRQILPQSVPVATERLFGEQTDHIHPPLALTELQFKSPVLAVSGCSHRQPILFPCFLTVASE